MDENATAVDRSKTIKPILFVLIALGIFFRFYNIDVKEYWHDEAITSVHISGNTKSGAKDAVAGRLIQFIALEQFYRPHPEQGFEPVWNSWSEDQPEKSPLYYILAYWSACTMGSDITSMRMLPAILSLLQLPVFYWFAVELFGSSLAGWMAVALVSLSPFQLLYAQEAREYSLITATVALVGACLLRCLRSPSTSAWVCYGLALTLSVYTTMLTLFVWMAHLCFMVLRERLKWSNAWTGFCVSSGLAGLAFTPWIMVVFSHLTTGYGQLDWMKQETTWANRIYMWLLNLTVSFFDVGDYYDKFGRVVFIVVLGLIFYSIYVVYRHAPRFSRLLLLLTFIMTASGFVLPDVLFGGVRSLVIKFMMPVPVVLIMCMAFMLYHHSIQRKATIFWCALAFVFLCEIASCTASSQAPTWMNKKFRGQQNFVEIARRLNGSKNAILVSETGPLYVNFTQMLALSRKVDPEVRLLFLNGPAIPDLPVGTKDFYLFNPTPEFLKLLKAGGYTVSNQDGLSYFFQAEKL